MIPVYPRRIKWQENMNYKGRLNNIGMAFGFISSGGEQVAPFSTCRDYLHDMVFTQINGWDSCYYSGYLVGKAPKISLSQVRLAVVNTHDDEFQGRVERALAFIHKIEADLKIGRRSMAYRIKNPPMAFEPAEPYFYVGPEEWMLSGPLLSLYTLALRVGFDAIEDAPFEETFEMLATGRRMPYANGHDATICKSAIHGIRRLKAEGVKKVFYTDPRANYPTGALQRTHSKFGIAGFSSGAPREFSPSWYPKDWKEPGYLPYAL